MDNDAVLFIPGDKLLKIFIETLDHIRADGTGALASLAPIGNGFKGERAPLQTAFCIVI
jgi:hypothetical protein